MIYLDNAATTIYKPECVVSAVAKAMTTMGNASRGAHGTALSASRVVYQTRVKLADFFGCENADHVVFTQNATEALNIAIRGAIKPGSHVITTDMEHNSVLRPLYLMEREQGVTLSFAKTDELGALDMESLKGLITEETSAIVCTHASNLTGNVVDVARVGKIAKENNLLFILDASQSAGAIPIDMKQMNIDILCFTGHKGLMGPQGTGGLCIRDGIEVEAFKRGGSGVHSYDKDQPREYPTRLEAGTLNSHGIAGLSAAIDYIKEIGIERIRSKEERLTRMFYEGVRQIRGVTVYGDFEHPHSAVVAINIKDYDSAMVADALAEDYDIAIRAGAHCAPRMHQALGTTEQGAVRFSFAWHTTEDEVKTAIEAVKELAK